MSKNSKRTLLKTIAVMTMGMAVTSHCFAAEKTVDIYHVSASAENKGIGEKMGTITFKETKKGLAVHPDLKGLTPGEHGFHIHENPSCDSAEKDGKWVAADAAGSHFDPEHTSKHLGPKGKGHLGDLPKLVVNKKGKAEVKGTASRLTLKDIEGHSVVIHEHGDNYSDHPALGGGGPRIACGVIAK